MKQVIQFLGWCGSISSAERPHGHGGGTGQCRNYGACPSSQKILLGGLSPETVLWLWNPAASATSPGGCRGSSATRGRPGNRCIPAPGPPCSREKSLLSGMSWVSLSDRFLTRLLYGSLRLFKNGLLNLSELITACPPWFTVLVSASRSFSEELENASSQTAEF